jgi:single-strand DNA-binding protein
MSVKLIGVARLGQDAEIRHLQNGTAVCNLSLAYNFGKKGQDGKRPSQWVEASLFGDRAESLAPHLTKGTSLFVDLRDVHVQTFQKKDGSSGVKLTGTVDSLEFAGNRPGNEAPARPQKKSAPFDDLDSDVPF